MNFSTIFSVLVMGLLASNGAAPNGPRIWILSDAPKHSAELGTNVTFSCFVSNPGNSQRELDVKWDFHGILSRSCTFLTAPNTSESCNLTVSPERASSGGVYKCELFDGQQIYRKNVTLVVGRGPVSNPTAPETTMELWDYSTEDPVDTRFGPICIQSGINQTFGCTVRGATPGPWNITWTLGDTEVKAEPFHVDRGAGEFVNVNSTYTLSSSGTEGLMKNLTCRATSHDGHKPLSVTVQLQYCYDPECDRTLLWILLSVIVIVAVAGIIAHILIRTYYYRPYTQDKWLF